MASPQHYISEGIKRGYDRAVLKIAQDQIDDFEAEHVNTPALLTLNHLVKRVSEDYSYIRNVVSRNTKSDYLTFSIRKRSGGFRRIHVPSMRLMKLQRWISFYILRQAKASQYSFAFSPECSTEKCARQHCKSKWLIKLDIADFFGSISESDVYEAFLSLGYQPLVSFELARITTIAPPSSRYRKPYWQSGRDFGTISRYYSNRKGFLPQGAPTSPMLSNLVMLKKDILIAAVAKQHGLRYTRYSDDITFSTRKAYSRSQARAIIHSVSEILRSFGLRLNTDKTIIVPPGGRKVVLGLTVNGSRPTLSKEFKSKLKMHMHFIEKFGLQHHADKRGFDTAGGLYRHVKGLIDYAHMIDPNYSEIYKERLNTIPFIESQPSYKVA